MSTSKLFQNREKANELYLKFMGKTQEEIDKDVDIIVEWLKSQPHLPEILSRSGIALFLKTNKCSIENTKKHIDMFYTIKNILPEVFENSHPRDPEMQEIIQKAYHLVLPKLTKEGNAVIWIKIREPYNTKDYLRSLGYMFNVIEVRMAEELSAKDILVYDLENHTMSQVLKMTPTVLRILQIIYKHVFSARLEKIIIVKSPVSEKLADILKRFLSKKLNERLVFLDSYERLIEYVPKEVLPSNYGGDEMSLDEIDELWRAKLVEYYPRFDEIRKMRVKEELRPTPLNNDDILGYYGNFKQLDVD